MNTLKLSLLTLAFCLAGVAHADYSCISHDGKMEMKVNEINFTRIGNTSIDLKSDEMNITYYGFMQIDNGPFITHKKVIFFNDAGTLRIIKKSLSCGRGSCDHNSGVIITAKLELNDQVTYFTCNG